MVIMGVTSENIFGVSAWYSWYTHHTCGKDGQCINVRVMTLKMGVLLR